MEWDNTEEFSRSAWTTYSIMDNDSNKYFFVIICNYFLLIFSFIYYYLLLFILAYKVSFLFYSQTEVK